MTDHDKTPHEPRRGQIWSIEAFSPEELGERVKPLDIRFQQLKAGCFHINADGVFLHSVLVAMVRDDVSVKTSGTIYPAALQFHNARSAPPSRMGSCP